MENLEAQLLNEIVAYNLSPLDNYFEQINIYRSLSKILSKNIDVNLVLPIYILWHDFDIDNTSYNYKLEMTAFLHDSIISKNWTIVSILLNQYVGAINFSGLEIRISGFSKHNWRDRRDRIQTAFYIVIPSRLMPLSLYCKYIYELFISVNHNEKLYKSLAYARQWGEEDVYYSLAHLVICGVRAQKLDLIPIRNLCDALSITGLDENNILLAVNYLRKKYEELNSSNKDHDLFNDLLDEEYCTNDDKNQLILSTIKSLESKLT